MLGTPPPGFNVPHVNNQTLGYLSQPGYQGAQAQGYNPGASSFAQPSSAHMPSSQIGQPGSPGASAQPGMNTQAQMMLRALGGHR
jgi:hypothetical protein